MTTLSTKARDAYNAVIEEDEREHPGQTWAGFEHQRDAFEEGYETGHKAAVAEPLDGDALKAALTAAINASDIMGCGCCGGGYDYDKYETREEALAADLSSVVLAFLVGPDGAS